MRKKIKVLIVEDVLLIQRLIKHLIEPYADCTAIASGKRALDLFTREYFNGDPFDLVCLDIYLPEVDGINVLENIRTFEEELKLSEEEQTKIIMISSLTNLNMIKKTRSLGSNGYITKPFSKSDVIAELEKLALIKPIEETS